jgi:hypothetical protein
MKEDRAEGRGVLAGECEEADPDDARSFVIIARKSRRKSIIKRSISCASISASEGRSFLAA